MEVEVAGLVFCFKKSKQCHVRDWRCSAINLSKAWDNLKPRYGSTRSVFQVMSLLMLRSTLESKCSISSPGHEEMIDQHSDSFKSHGVKSEERCLNSFRRWIVNASSFCMELLSEEST